MTAAVDVTAPPIQGRVDAALRLAAQHHLRVKCYSVAAAYPRPRIVVHLSRLDGGALDLALLQRMLRDLDCPWADIADGTDTFHPYDSWARRFVVGDVATGGCRYVLVGDKA